MTTGRWRLTLRVVAMLVLGVGCAAVLAPRLAEVEGAAVLRAMAALHPVQWLAALALTGISFAAAGRYDAVLHRHLGTGVSGPAARRAGVAAIAVSQMLGLGMISGAILRWRMLPALSLAQAARVTAAVAASFLAAWATGTALVLVLLPGAPFKGAAVAVLALALGLAGLSLVAGGRRWPNALTMGRLFGLCAVDMLAAAGALAVLLPGADFSALLPAFLLAYGAGLVAATPGGAGPFEVTLLALLPGEPEADLLTAVLVWRMIYHALPALAGAALALRGPLAAPPPAPPVLLGVGPAELGLAAQGEHQVVAAGPGAAWLAGRTPHLLVGLLAPTGTSATAAALTALTRAAQGEDRLAAVYKADARLAAQARAQGWQALRIAAEAVITPADWRLTTASHAGLRRKLRRAEAAGVTVLGPRDHLGALPWSALDAIAAAWRSSHGGERGFSMGRYTRAYLAGQRVYLALQAGRPIAFASFHDGAAEWVLDLMRHPATLPDGTMQALLVAAIGDARHAGLPRLSLAAVPMPTPGAPHRLRAAWPGDRGHGLIQFKAAFAPVWEPRYLLARSRPALVLAAAEIAREIHAPPALPPIPGQPADYEFATAAAPWQEGANHPTDEGAACLRINSRNFLPPATG